MIRLRHTRRTAEPAAPGPVLLPIVLVIHALLVALSIAVAHAA